MGLPICNLVIIFHQNDLTLRMRMCAGRTGLRTKYLLPTRFCISTIHVIGCVGMVSASNPSTQQLGKSERGHPGGTWVARLTCRVNCGLCRGCVET